MKRLFALLMADVMLLSLNSLHSLKGKIPHPLSSFPIFSILLQISAARSFSFLTFLFSTLTTSEHEQRTLAW